MPETMEAVIVAEAMAQEPEEKIPEAIEIPEPPEDGNGKRLPWTPRELRYAEAYIKTGNATQAYFDSKYGRSKSRIVAGRNASEIMRGERMKVLLAPAMRELQSRVTPDNVTRLIQSRLGKLPDEEKWEWNHWLRVLKLAATASGLISKSEKEYGRSGVAVGTMNIVNMNAAMTPVQDVGTERR